VLYRLQVSRADSSSLQSGYLGDRQRAGMSGPSAPLADSATAGSMRDAEEASAGTSVDVCGLAVTVGSTGSMRDNHVCQQSCTDRPCSGGPCTEGFPRHNGPVLPSSMQALFSAAPHLMACGQPLQLP